MKVCFETFGCRLNRAEALQTEADYIAAGWTVVKSHADADLVVVRGCSVTRRAERDTLALIDHLSRWYPFLKIHVTGCIRVPMGSQMSVPRSYLVKSGDAVPMSTARAYLKVQDGCSGKCTFCIVPQFRGKASSVPFDEVLGRAARFREAGYHEIVMTGCNLSLYASEGRRLPELLDALAAVSPDLRIRLGSLEPGFCDGEIVDLIAGRPNICRFLHLPIQSASPTVLRTMRRPYSFGDVQRTLKLVAEKLPGAGLGCDLMTGFPGEGEYDFLATDTMLSQYPFTNVHVFPYSERPGTPAELMGGVVSPDVRKSRARQLAKHADALRRAAARRFVGRVVEIVVEGSKPITGWTSEYFKVEVRPRDEFAERRSLLRVRVIEAHDGVLYGVRA